QLFGACPELVRAKLLDMMRRAEDPWHIAELYSGRQHFLDVPTLDFLLNDMATRLRSALATPDWGTAEPLWWVMKLVAGVNTLELIVHFRNFAGSDLEAMLAAFLLRIGPRRGRDCDSLVRDEAIEVLYRIGGDAFTHVINEFLTAQSQFGVLDAI